jgi:dTDP-glucose 4,6-dehydratase
VFGDGSQTRSFCYVDDLIEGIWRLLNSDLRTPCNLGNPDEMTIRQFADAILAVTGGASPIVHQPLPEDDPKVRQPDITLARTRLGWEPRVPLEEGLRRTVEDFRQRLGELVAAAEA